MDQRGLVERARDGDHEAFTALIDLTIARLDAAARLILRDPELARDAVQDALFRAWRDLKSLRDPDRFDAWLHRLTVNACLDIARRRVRRPIEVAIIDLDRPSSFDMSAEVADREILDQALAGIDPAHRAVVVLHYFLGMSVPEVARAMGIPAGTAKSRLHYAVASMRASLSDEPTAARVRVAGGHSA